VATFTARAVVTGEDTEIFRIFASGEFQVGLGRFADESFREEFRRRLLGITEVELAGKGTWPSGMLAPLNRPETWDKFRNVLQWLVAAIR
jgi:hypothetical protein